MLNTFPALLSFGLIAPFILRLALGGIFILSGYAKTFKKRDAFSFVFEELGLPTPFIFAWTFGLIELIGGTLLVVGFGTQAVAIIFSIITTLSLVIKVRRRDLLKQSMSFYIFALAISLSLIFSGAGFLAFDLPL